MALEALLVDSVVKVWVVGWLWFVGGVFWGWFFFVAVVFFPLLSLDNICPNMFNPFG